MIDVFIHSLFSYLIISLFNPHIMSMMFVIGFAIIFVDSFR